MGKETDSFDPQRENLLREDSICMVNLMEIPRVIVIFFLLHDCFASVVVYVNPKQCRSQISSSLSFFIVVDRPIQRSTSGILSLYLCNSK